MSICHSPIANLKFDSPLKSLNVCSLCEVLDTKLTFLFLSVTVDALRPGDAFRDPTDFQSREITPSCRGDLIGGAASVCARKP